MREIDNGTALQKLWELGLPCVMEWDALHYLMEENKQVICYDGGEWLLIFNREKDAEQIMVVPLAEQFVSDDLMRFIQTTCSNPNILLSVKMLSPDFSKLLCAQMQSVAEHTHTILDYAYFGDGISQGSGDVRLLCAEDRAAFLGMPMEPVANRPPLSVLFDLFIGKNMGQILGIFDGAKLAGCLSFFSVANLFDVDYIYVVPELRRNGLGKKLANAYVSYAKSQNSTAYWSNAKNDASAKTAISCGFELVRQVERFC